MDMKRIEEKTLEYVASAYELTRRNQEPVRFSASGMEFETVGYDAKGLGSVAFMQASGMGGKMQMTSLVINPFQKDAPLCSCDRISAMGQEMLCLELFDTTLGHGFDLSRMVDAADACEDVPDMEHQKHWYDSMLMGDSIMKKGSQKDAEALEKAQSLYIEGFLEACKLAPNCDEEQKRARARKYSEGLLKNGGPATDPVKAALGEEATAEFFGKILFATDV